MTRTIPKALAPVVEALELEQAAVLTTQQLSDLIVQVGVATPAPVAIQRLAERGWLLATGVHGTWEFSPGAHAGAYSRGDPLLPVRAQLAVTPDLPVRVALGSALWRHGLADRPPEQHELSVPSRTYVPEALARSFRIVRFRPALPPVSTDVPVDAATTVLVHLAASPTDVRSWGEVLGLLPELADQVTPAELTRELEGRPHATRVRLAYLLDGVAPQLVDVVGVEPRSKVWFGPRRTLRRHSAKWNVADTLLPDDPGSLGRRA